MKRRWTLAVLGLALLLVQTSGPGIAATTTADEPVASTSVSVDIPVGDSIVEVADALDGDLGRIFRFVSDEIRYEPYVGLLRGAAGTLAVRAGNSVDQAVLLAELLRASGLTVRYVQGTLEPAVERELVASITLDREAARTIDQGALDDGWRRFAESIEATASGAAAARPQAGSADLEATRTRLDRVSDDLAGTLRLIEDALASSGQELAEGPAVIPASEREAHTWLQVAFGADWLDLDPVMAGWEAGRVLAEPDSVMDSLPDGVRHRIDLEVDVERVAGDALETSRAITYSGFADGMSGIPIRFGHTGPTGAEAFGLAIATALGEGGTVYRPLLGIGGLTLVADEDVAFRIADSDDGGGLLEDSSLLEVAPDANGSEPAPRLPNGEAMAEWLTIRVTAPGRDPVEARRAVFDRLPAGWRESGDIALDTIAPIELVDLDGSGSLDCAPMLGTETIVIANGPTDATAMLGPLTGPDPDSLAVLGLAYHGLRDSLNADDGIRAGSRAFVAGPNIASYSLDVDGVGTDARIRLAVDVWHRAAGVLPLEDSTLTPSRARMTADVMTQIAERVAMDGLGGPSAAAHAHGGGVSDVFASARQAGIGTIAIAEQMPIGAAYPEGAIPLIEAALRDGDIVIIPEAAVEMDGRQRIGWWRVDPLTGATRDVMDDGAGEGEYFIPVSNALRTAACVFSYTAALFSVAGVVAGVLFGEDTAAKLGYGALAAIGGGAPAAIAGAVCRTPKKPTTPKPPSRPRTPNGQPPDFLRTPDTPRPTGSVPPPPPMPPRLPFPTIPKGKLPPLPKPPPPRGPFGTLIDF